MMDVAILGATGAVGQRFVQLLHGHPFFTVRELAASGRSAGLRYAAACHWTLPLALKPLHDAFGLERVMVTTLQALSGAGYPGVPALDLLDNVLPHIGGEEDKLETEPRKILGIWRDGAFVDAPLAVSAACNRVATADGHLECVSVDLGLEASRDEVTAALRAYRSPLRALGLPSAPDPVVIVRQEPDRPQPRLDRDAGRGMAVTIGRIASDRVLGHRFVVLSHNTIRGAAGAAILNAELLVARGYLAGAAR